MSRLLRLIAAASVLSLCVSHLSLQATARTAEEWKSRSIYQIITDRFSLPPPSNSTADCANIHSYCGGTWSGIASRLDYIQSLGFNAIWISPVPENTPNAFHGYSALNLYELNHYFGTPDEFVAMIAECHSRDVWVMVRPRSSHTPARVLYVCIAHQSSCLTLLLYPSVVLSALAGRRGGQSHGRRGLRLLAARAVQ